MASNILLVKSEDPARAVLAAALDRIAESGAPLKVTMAADSREALQHAGDQTFDLVLADLVLPKPGLSGAETLRRVCELHPAARTLLFSEHACVRELLRNMAEVFLDLDRGREVFLEELTHHVTELLARPEGRGPRHIDDITTLASSRAGGSIAAAKRPRLIAGKYQLGQVLGKGGMGVVYRAEDTFIGRPVAVKLLRVRTTQSRDGLLRRMRREVRIAGRLDHPNIVTIFDAGFDGEEMYFVMELIEGRNLRQLLRERGALPCKEAVGIVLQALDAVSHAHRQHVVHRDLKPANLLLTPAGKVKVVDFGVAKMVSVASSCEQQKPRIEAWGRETARGMVIGTRGYMAPEQLVGDEVDHRADLYALGAVLYEMLRGQPLAGRGSKSRGASPGLDRAASLRLPGEPQLTLVLQKALALLPEHRYRDGVAFAAALEGLATPSWKRFFFGS